MNNRPIGSGGGGGGVGGGGSGGMDRNYSNDYSRNDYDRNRGGRPNNYNGKDRSSQRCADRITSLLLLYTLL